MPQSSLEQEAMDRVRRMYASFDNRRKQPERAKAPVEAPPETQEESPGEAPSKEPHNTHDDARVDAQSTAQPPSVLDFLLREKDQSLILLLLVLLIKDAADMNLILALVYLLVE